MSNGQGATPDSAGAGTTDPATAEHVPAAAPPERVDRDSLPTLYRDRSYWGMVATQFFGAFNDNLFKQLMLMLAVGLAVGDRQGFATIIFSAPFVLFSGYAGYLSDKFSKRPIIILSKVAEIVVMALGLLAFFSFGVTGIAGLAVVLFLMGTQSAFFGPGKYGILPEMLRERDLPQANGLMLMTTFFAIILGTASGGFLKDLLAGDDQPLNLVAGNLCWASVICVAIAIVGTLTSLAIRRVRPAKPDLELRGSSFAIPPDTRKMLLNDRPLLAALGASSMFWLVGGIVILVVNAFGNKQLKLGATWTSALTAITSLGIAAGAVIAGRVSRGKVDFRIVRVGAWGLVGGLMMMSLPGIGTNSHLLGFWGSLPVLVLLGMFAGLFAIPVQVFLQARPPNEQKGRMIAVMNQANFIAILFSGMIYQGFVAIVDAVGWPRSPMFAFTALIMLPVAAFYRPKNADLT